MVEKVYLGKVADDLYVLRVDDVHTVFFEALWEIPERISYNAYLLVKGDHVVLFDGWKERYADLFLETLKSVADPRDITEVIVHHLEPDHSGSIKKLAQVNSKAVFYGHPLAGKMLKSFYGVSRFKPLPDGATIDIGTPAKFIHTPWLHWPETSITYLQEYGVLLTCDAFGSYSLQPLFDDEVDLVELEREIRKYFVTVIGHYAPNVSKAIRKLEEAAITPRVIAPGHGTILRSHIKDVLNFYSNLAEGKSVNKATIIYVSMYGNVEAVASHVGEVLKARSIPVEVYAFTDSSRANVSDALASMTDSRLVVLGAATYEADVQPLIRFLVDIIGEKLSYRRDLRFLVLAPYAWSGIAGKKIVEKLKGFGFMSVEAVEWEGLANNEVLERVSQKLEQLII
ncbi:MAG: FprA family A-type flavoprotein [Infirmifilum sp.]